MTFLGRCRSDHATWAGSVVSSCPAVPPCCCGCRSPTLGDTWSMRGRGGVLPVCNPPEAAHSRVLSGSPGTLGPSGEPGQPAPTHHHGLQAPRDPKETVAHNPVSTPQSAWRCHPASPRPPTPAPTMVCWGKCSRLYKNHAPRPRPGVVS